MPVAAAGRPPLAEEGTARGKVLDPVIVPVGYVNVAVAPVSDAFGELELAVAATLRAPFAEERAGRREILDAVVPIVRHVNDAVRQYR